MQFYVTKQTERELDQIFVYWARRASVDVAEKIVDSIEERFSLLGDYPFVGRKCDELAPGVFRFPVGDYLIYYRKKRSVLHILHVLHGARDQASAFGNN
ncbi:MAG: type II toxin-antitoxin system RelE/ParE family toxin [Terracidiphilus sp.]